MHSGDHNAAFGLHDRGDGFRATEQRFSATARGQENWIVVLNRGGKNNKVRSVRMLSEMLFMKAQAEPLQSLGLCGCTFVRAAYCVSQLNEKPGKTAHTASRNTDEVNPMLFGGQKSRQVWQWITTPRFFALRIGARGSCFRRELHEWYIFQSCSPRDQLHLSAQGAHNSPPFAVAVAGFPPARGCCARAIHQRDPTASEELPHRPDYRFLHCAFGDHPRRMEMESGCRATKSRRTPPGWPRPLAQRQDQRRCTLPPSDDETHRCKQGHFPGDSCLQPGVHPARRTGGSPGAAHLARTAVLRLAPD